MENFGLRSDFPTLIPSVVYIDISILFQIIGIDVCRSRSAFCVLTICNLTFRGFRRGKFSPPTLMEKYLKYRKIRYNRA